MNKEDKIRIEAGQAWVEIDKLILKLKDEQRTANVELDDLNRRLPHLLVGMVKGHVTRNEVRSVKTRIAELQETIRDIPVILQELEREKRLRCFEPLQDAHLLSKERTRYHTLKELLMERCEPQRIEELRRYARDIDEIEDCECFLAQLTLLPAMSK